MSLHVTVRYFASLREALQRGSEEVATRAATLGELRRELAARLGVRAVRMALNQVMAGEGEALAAGAEVAFFPPVTGG